MSQRYFLIIAFIILLAACLIPRVLDLDKFLTADERRWATNTGNFTRALARGRWDETLQQAHPGITTQWLGALTIHSPDWAVRKLPLVIGQSILIFMIGYVYLRLLGKMPAILLVLLLSLNPFLIAHTRVYAMDSLLALFLLLSVSLLLLWNKAKETRYLVFAAMTAAAAWLSKLPGILIVPFSLLFLLLTPSPAKGGDSPFVRGSKTARFPLLTKEGWSPRAARVVILWLFVFFLTSIFILPALATNTHNALQDILAFFSSTNYESEHPAPASYYFGTLFFFSTPVQMFALALLFLNLTPSLSFVRRGGLLPAARQLIPLLAFALLFFIMMSVGAKKGDRYILPVFVFLDAVAAIVISSVILNIGSLKIDWKLEIGNWKFWGALITLILILHLAWVNYTLHPYYLAYVNPLTKAAFADRRLGWGEGLDLAAEFLNQKPDAEHLKVAAYYPNEFAYKFKGEVVPAHQWEDDSVNYVVLYRAMFERGPEAWETDVLEKFQQKTPEKLFRLNELDYVWVYGK